MILTEYYIEKHTKIGTRIQSTRRIYASRQNVIVTQQFLKKHSKLIPNNYLSKSYSRCHTAFVFNITAHADGYLKVVSLTLEEE